MAVDVLIGAQYGSEGKGKIAGYLAREYEMSIRTGGPNAGHTVEHLGKIFKLRQVPSAFVNKNCLLGIGSGAYINIQVLLEEVKECNVEDRLLIDHHAGVIEPRHMEAETELRERIGSTGAGVGAAMSDKVLRLRSFRLAKDVPEIRSLLGDVVETANKLIDSCGNVLLEGTQGYGLSLHHGRYYPFATSRDTTAGTLCGECGISPRLVNDIILIMRTYPIRVAGNSGPLPNEITWKTVTEESGSTTDLIERTSVTKRVRRVGRFEIEMVKRAVMINRPTQIALNFIDYINHEDLGKNSFDKLTPKSKKFIAVLEQETCVPVTLIGTGPQNADIIDLRKEKLHR